ncbi:MAG: hypothetical protein RBT74_06590 [Tenuifilaceae bacterium]|nr:hypothetical protein [Tenuifilaceae bacterium]
MLVALCEGAYTFRVEIKAPWYTPGDNCMAYQLAVPASNTHTKKGLVS